MKLTNIGYYLIEPEPKPDCISLPCDVVLSVSRCICDAHPKLTGCFWLGYAAEKAEYRKKLALTENAFEELQAEVIRLFETNLLDKNSRFLRLEDAVHFFQAYLGNLAGVKLVSMSTTQAYVDGLTSNSCWEQNGPYSREPVSGELLGGEILGYDISNFESYLCNSLEEELSGQWLLSCDPNTGLLQHSFEELEEFAAHMQGMGEPVDWMPFLLHDCTPG